MIFLYNPSTDLALASGQKTYTPPKNIVDFERRNMLIPSLMAGGDDATLLLYDVDADLIPKMPFYNAEIRLCHLSDLRDTEEMIKPWGWNEAIRSTLIRHGVPSSLVPSSEEIACWRELSHRRTAAQANKLLDVNEGTVPWEFFDSDEALKFLEKTDNAVLKMPWSSSGRGILRIKDGETEKAKRRIKDSIARQGSIMIESHHTKILDFATEWESDGANVRFCGYSLFETDNRGRYLGNRLWTQEEIISKLIQYAERRELIELQQALTPVLTELLIKRPQFPYEGPFGVDALIAAEGKIIPCIEINLRCTMGHLAILTLRKHPEMHGQLLRAV